MKILEFQFANRSTGWVLDRVFFDGITLFVGASGVGKSQILRSLALLRRLAQGKSTPSICFSFKAEIDAAIYEWECNFEEKAIGPFGNFFFGPIDDEVVNQTNIEREVIRLDGAEIARRDGVDTFFEDKKTVRLAQNESLVSLLKEEPPVRRLYDGIRSIKIQDNTSQRLFLNMQPDDAGGGRKDVDDLRNFDAPALTKLHIASEEFPEVFLEIVDAYREIFPFVESVRFHKVPVAKKNVWSPIFAAPQLQIKEHGIGEWIWSDSMSSGMIRTLCHLIDLYLSKEGSVFLIDEFENSLGVNCIDRVVDVLVDPSRELQYIITSHHPYIINSINPEMWKLVTRRASTTFVRPVDSETISASKHDAFLHLINDEDYMTGGMAV